MHMGTHVVVVPLPGLFPRAVPAFEAAVAAIATAHVAAAAAVANAQQAAGGFWVLRPDSGDPVEVVLMVRTKVKVVVVVMHEQRRLLVVVMDGIGGEHAAHACYL